MAASIATSARRVRPAPAVLAAAVSAAVLLGLLISARAGAADDSPAETGAADPAPAQLARSFDAILDARKAANTRSAEVQKQIDEIADETDAISAQYRNTEKQIAAIRQFNDRMRKLIQTQESDLASVSQQLGRVDEVGRSVTPLMLRMIDALEEFVKLDVPFLPGERTERIAGLRDLMIRSDVTSSTKYRQIMETYQIENEYGRTIEAYRDRIEIDGKLATVDLLRFGRVALVYRTLDGSRVGVWNQQARSWQELPSSYADAVSQGIRIARKLVPPDLIELPLLPPEVETASN